MLNVDGGRGESSLLLLYNSSYNLLHRQTPFPPMAGLQPRSLLLPVRVDACWLASGFALRLSPRCTSVIPTPHPHQLDHLILYILTISQQPRPTHSQRPPIKLAQGSTLLFGSFPSSP